jgi:hypothetical protein
VTGLDYDRITLDPRELSYAGQVRRLESDGWELEPHQRAPLRYLRRHRRVGEILGLFIEHGQRLRLTREEDGTWSAALLPRPSGSISTAVSGGSALEAAEGAWSLFEEDQGLQGSCVSDPE